MQANAERSSQMAAALRAHGQLGFPRAHDAPRSPVWIRGADDRLAAYSGASEVPAGQEGAGAHAALHAASAIRTVPPKETHGSSCAADSVRDAERIAQVRES